MKNVTKNTKVEELEVLWPELKGQFDGGCGFIGGLADQTLEEAFRGENSPIVEDVLYGLSHLNDNMQVFKLESGASLIYMPAENKKTDQFALLLGGGGYLGVGTLTEAMPTAAEFMELGMDCFCLNYSIGEIKEYWKGVMPKPLYDIKLALQLISEHAKDFQVDAENYVMAGFSAGGHACGMWGTKDLGARSYGLSNPKAILFVYPLLIPDQEMDDERARLLCVSMLGTENLETLIPKYNVTRNIDSDYPPSFIVRAKDDPMVDGINGDRMIAALQEKNIRYQLMEGEHGGHSFGLGNGTDLKGWAKKAILFLKENEEKRDY